MQVHVNTMIEYWPQQSPIDLVDAIYAPDLTFSFQNYDTKKIHGKIKPADHGHGYEFVVDVDPSAPQENKVALRFGAIVCPLVKFHFHAPSEHRMRGVCADLELHLVHDIPCPSAGSSKVALGILFQIDLDNTAKPNEFKFLEALNTRFKAFDSGVGKKADSSKNEPAFDLSEFVKANFDPQFYLYEGSLTTPAYVEVVRWVILGEIFRVPASYINDIVKKVTHPPRPLQALNRRYLLRNFKQEVKQAAGRKGK